MMESVVKDLRDHGFVVVDLEDSRNSSTSSSGSGLASDIECLYQEMKGFFGLEQSIKKR